MLVADAMTPNPLVVAPSLPLHKALEIMRNNDVRHLIVVTGDTKLAGMVTDRDIKRHMSQGLETKDETPEDRRSMLASVAQIMTSDPYVVHADQPLKEVVDMMHRGKFGAVPVLDDADRPVGILSSIDLLRVLHGLL